jgi:hypothetical protein
MNNDKSSFRKLVELTDKAIRDQFAEEPVYYLSESRLDNLLLCLEHGAAMLKQQEEEIARLKFKLQAIYELVEFEGE